MSLNDGQAFVPKSAHPHVEQFIRYSSAYSPLVVSTTLNQKILDTPILVPQADLTIVGMTLPRPAKEIDLDYITSKVGEDTPIEVMDVLSQQGVQPAWNMGKWRDYFKMDSVSRDRIRNVISLEISDVEELGVGFTRPKLVRDLDLVDKVWDPEDEQLRLKVTKYCLMSVAGAFTDFHIDFGGTSVYYTVCSGAKSFLMFPPTEHNLGLYRDWCLEQEQNSIWFPEYGKMPFGGFKVTLQQGDLFMIPSGWIHAVHTPIDSIVIGGNFLTLLDMQKQLEINLLEKETRVPLRFRFPMFNKVLWYTSWYYLNHQGELEEALADENFTSQAERNDSHKRLKDGDQTDKFPVEAENKEAVHSIKDELDRKEYIRQDGKANETQSMANYNGQVGITNNSLVKSILSSLKAHLCDHYELSRTNPTAKRSIPFHLIGKDVKHYLSKIQNWNDSYNGI